jgi:hypothetical protein
VACGKMKHPTRQAAEAHRAHLYAEDARRRGRKLKSRTGRMNVYPCDAHGKEAWHVGHTEKDATHKKFKGQVV